MKMREGCSDTATYWTKAAVTLVLVLWWWLGPVIGYCPIGDEAGGMGGEALCGTLWAHVLWPLSHANVWHLAGNLWVLWLLNGPLSVRVSYVIAVLCSFIPVLPGVWELLDEGELPCTVGFSGVLCVMIGIKWGKWCRSSNNVTAYWTFAKRVLPFIVAGIIIPHVNWSIHLYCVLMGLAYGRCK